jgi:hypothetical protein
MKLDGIFNPAYVVQAYWEPIGASGKQLHIRFVDGQFIRANDSSEAQQVYRLLGEYFNRVEHK